MDDGVHPTKQICANRAHNFGQGLRLDIQNYITTSKVETYTEVVDAVVEKVIDKEKRIKASVPKRFVG